MKDILIEECEGHNIEKSYLYKKPRNKELSKISDDANKVILDENPRNKDANKRMC